MEVLVIRPWKSESGLQLVSRYIWALQGDPLEPQRAEDEITWGGFMVSSLVSCDCCSDVTRQSQKAGVRTYEKKRVWESFCLFLLKHNWFTILYELLLCIKITQSYVHTHFKKYYFPRILAIVSCAVYLWIYSKLTENRLIFFSPKWHKVIRMF